MNRLPGHYIRRVWQHDPTLYAPPRYRRACSYEPFVPDPLAELRINLDESIAGLVSDAERAIVALNAVAGPRLAPLARLLLRTESVASSKIEGMQVDARTLARAEANQDGGRSIGRTTADILANIDAMELAIERAAGEQAMSVATLQEIHRALMARDPDAGPSEIRTVQNWIGGNDYNACDADFVPPPPEEINRLLLDLCTFCDGETLPPLVQAAIAHAQLETVHPFKDGNGRAGRALVQIVLRRRGLASRFVPPISVMLARNRERYIEGLNLFHGDVVTGWIATFSEAAAAAAQLAARYLKRVQALQDEWRNRLATSVRPRADAAAWPLIDVLPAHPVLSTTVGMAATARTRPAVANGIDQLVACGVLVPIGTSPKTRAWESAELLDLIIGLEAGDALAG